jgi:HK97 gp10 family phage protein
MTIVDNSGFSATRKKYGIEIQGIEEAQKNLATLAARIGEDVAKAAVMGGNLVRSSAIQSIQAKSGGQTVTRSREGGGTYEHTAAAAGSAPNTDTGRLVASIQVEVKDKDVFVGSTLEYAGALEFGTRYMLPRPWLNPALELRRREIQRMFKDAANKDVTI